MSDRTRQCGIKIEDGRKRMTASNIGYELVVNCPSPSLRYASHDGHQISSERGIVYVTVEIESRDELEQDRAQRVEICDERQSRIFCVHISPHLGSCVAVVAHPEVVA